MKYAATDQQGSFIAQGIGLIYEYNAETRVLRLPRARCKDPLFATALDLQLAHEPFSYALNIEKITKIKALRFSDNATTNLAGTLENDRLSAVLSSSARLAHCAFNLQRHKFEDFSACFLKESGLESLSICRLASTSNSLSGGFQAEASTIRGPSIIVKSSSVHGVLRYLSESIVEDMVSQEYKIYGSSLADRLFSISTGISMLSHVLNDRFDPAARLERKVALHPQAAFEKKAHIKQ